MLVIVGALVVPQLGQSMFPEFKERDFLMHWVTEPSTSYPEETRIVTLASKELRTIPGSPQFRLAHRTGVPGRGGGRYQLRRKLDQR